MRSITTGLEGVKNASGLEVVRSELLPVEEAMARLGGFVGMDPTSPGDYEPIPEIDVPDTAAYVLHDVDLGAEFLDVTPDDALAVILGRGRSPLTILEGVAVLARYPEVLTEQHAFSLLGSRRGDRRVPALWTSKGSPRLGWCWAGAPHSWLGSASCSERAVSG